MSWRANGVSSCPSGNEDGFHGGALGAEDGLDGSDVALAERVVLREDHDLLALGVDEGAGGGHVLQALAAGAEGVLVDALDGVSGGGTGDVEDLVLGCLLGELQRDAGDHGAADDLVALADQVLGRRDCLVRVAAVVRVGQVDLGAVDLAGPARGVVDAGLQALVVGGTVGGERTGLGVDDANVHRLGGLRAAGLSRGGGSGGGRAGAEGKPRGHHGGEQEPLCILHGMPFVLKPGDLRVGAMQIVSKPER